MNCQVDIIIIGDSKAGNNAVKKLASIKPSIKVAFISREFKSTTTHDYLNVEYIKDEVVFTDYRNRLFGCYLKNGDRIYGTHLVIATGLTYEPLLVNGKVVPNVFNTLEDISKTAKNMPAVLLWNQNSDIKFATSLAKKYKHIYLCTKNLVPENLTETNVKKLSDIKNIVILPNTSIIKAEVVNNTLLSVELDNYSKLTCSAIYVKTTAAPDVDFVSDKIISKLPTKHLIVDNNAESTIIPKCFAIGNCIKKSTKLIEQAMLDAISKDFSERSE